MERLIDNVLTLVRSAVSHGMGIAVASMKEMGVVRIWQKPAVAID